MRGFLYRHFLVLLALSTFIGTLVPKLFTTGFLNGDDPYYHTAHSLAYATGASLAFPAFSPLAIHPADPWFLYHVGMVPFVWLGQSFGDGGIFIAAEVYHAVLVTVFFVTFFLVVRSLAVAMLPVSRAVIEKGMKLVIDASLFPSPQSVAIVATTLAFLTTQQFVFRTIVIERPHIVMMTLTLAACWAILHGRTWSTVVIAAMAALSYSISVLILLPIAAMAVLWLLYDRSRPLGIAFGRALVATIAGLIIGIMLHPEPYGYLVNGILIHLYAVGHALVWWADSANTATPPAEMFLLRHPPSIIQIGMAAMIGFAIVRMFANRTVAYTIPAFVFLVMGSIGVFFTAVQVVIPRAVEYAVPFTTATFTIMAMYGAWPVIRYSHYTLTNRNGEIGDCYRHVTDRAREIVTDRRIQNLWVLFSVTALVGGPLLLHIAMYRNAETADYTRYRDVAAHLQMIPHHLVLTERFDMYPQLIFHGPSNRYSTGMDSRFIDLYDEILAHDVRTFWQGDQCVTPSCEADKAVPASFYEHGITHVLVDEAKADATIAAFITSSEAFTRVYTDSRYPEVQLYELLPTTP
jgi:hypothetical protein